MNNPYPIPGGALTPQQAFTGPYFAVGNECCNGGMTNDVDARTMVMLDYTGQLSAGVNVVSIVYELVPPDVTGIILTDQALSNNIATFLVSRGLAGVAYKLEITATLDNGEIWVDHITVRVVDCGGQLSSSAPPILVAGPVIIGTTLYYIATAGQTVFSLDTPDKFNQVGSLEDSNAIVYANGSRLAPVDGYTLNPLTNTVTLVWPAGQGESIIIDLVERPPIEPPPPITPPLANSITMEPLTITTANILPLLTYAPDQRVLMLFVNGQAFFPVGPQAAFMVVSGGTGQALLWTSTLYSVPVGAAVIAVYTHA